MTVSRDQVSLRRPFVHIDAFIDDHPAIWSVSPWGGILFEALIRLSKRMGLLGHVPDDYWSGGYLADVLHFPAGARYTASGNDEPLPIHEEFKKVLESLVEVGLVVLCECESGCRRIENWQKYQRDPKSGAERKAEFDERKRGERTQEKEQAVTSGNAITLRGVTRNANNAEGEGEGEGEKREPPLPPVTGGLALSSASTHPKPASYYRRRRDAALSEWASATDAEITAAWQNTEPVRPPPKTKKGTQNGR